VRIVARSENTAETTTEAQAFAALQQENMKLQENNNALLTQLALLNQSNEAQTQQIVKLNNELSGFRLTFDRLEQSLADMTMKYSTLISQLHPTTISQPAPNGKTQTTLQNTTANKTVEDPMLLDNNRNRTWVNPQLPTKTTSTADSQHAHAHPQLTTNTTSTADSQHDQAHPRPWNAAAMRKVQQSNTTDQVLPPPSSAQILPPQSYAQATSKTTPSARPRKSYAAIAQKLTANKDKGNAQAAQKCTWLPPSETSAL
jgi:hypothetical protein